jgi:hypothetical protein
MILQPWNQYENRYSSLNDQMKLDRNDWRSLVIIKSQGK